MDEVIQPWVFVFRRSELLLTAAGLVGRDDPVAAPRPDLAPGGAFSPLVLTDRQARTIFYAAVVTPAMLLGLTAVALARRRRSA